MTLLVYRKSVDLLMCLGLPPKAFNSAPSRRFIEPSPPLRIVASKQRSPGRSPCAMSIDHLRELDPFQRTYLCEQGRTRRQSHVDGWPVAVPARPERRSLARPAETTFPFESKR